MFISDYVPTLVIVLFIVALFFLVSKKRAKKLTLTDNAPIEGTEAERLAAEEKLRAMPLDIREELVNTHELYDRFSTRQGFSREYFEDVSRQLNEAGISNEVIFQPAAPLGSMGTVIDQAGFFELFIEKGKRAQAQSLLGEIQRF